MQQLQQPQRKRQIKQDTIKQSFQEKIYRKFNRIFNFTRYVDMNKKLFKTYGILFCAGALLANICVWADTANYAETLPMSSVDIAKLQRLFSIGGNNFQMGPPHEHVVWQQTPIDVVLPVGKERMVSFPGAVSFGYDKSVLGDSILGVQNNNSTLYLTAKSAFTTRRVEVKCNDSGQIILLNLSAQANASDTALDIVMAQPQASQALSPPPSLTSNITSASDQSAQSTGMSSSFTDNTMSYVELTRFAVQQLYAPKRLLVQPPDIYRTPMYTHKTVPLFLDGSVLAMPLASWHGGDLTVTAVLLRNQLQQTNTLDARNLCGSWQAAAFFPQTLLAPAGQRADSTTVFLVANRAFSDAMQTCLRGF